MIELLITQNMFTGTNDDVVFTVCIPVTVIINYSSEEVRHPRDAGFVYAPFLVRATFVIQSSHTPL